MAYYALYEIIIKCLELKCNFCFQKYDIMIIFVGFYQFGWFFAYSDPHHWILTFFWNRKSEIENYISCMIL